MTELPSAEMKIGTYEHLRIEVLQEACSFPIIINNSRKLSVSAILMDGYHYPQKHFITYSFFRNLKSFPHPI